MIQKEHSMKQVVNKYLLILQKSNDLLHFCEISF